MNPVDLYKSKFDDYTSTHDEFTLVEYSKDVYIGLDREYNTCVLVKSSTPSINSMASKTKLLSLECNSIVKYLIDDESFIDAMHVLRCYCKSDKERNLFLELASVIIGRYDHSSQSMVEAFTILRSFFADNQELSEKELIGLYGELYTIVTFNEELKMGECWQSRMRNKFDFSFNERLKLEVKATTGEVRKHHFRHDQLFSETHDVFVVSYLLRYDDHGYSLYDLIQDSKKYFINDIDKYLRLETILKNNDEEILHHLKYDNEYTLINRRMYRAEDLPRFSEKSPEGVTNAEYNCTLDNCPSITINDFSSRVIEGMNRS